MPKPLSRRLRSQHLAQIESPAVIRNRGGNDGISPLQGDLNASGFGMFGNIVQGLLDDAVKSRFNLRREFLLEPDRLEVRVDIQPVGEVLDVPSQCGDQADIIEHGGPEVHR